MEIKNLKPITIFNSIWYFIISSALIYLGLYVITPYDKIYGLLFLCMD
jgi:hypothetical protein